MVDLLLLNTVGFCGALLLLCWITSRAGSGNTFAHLFSLAWGPCILAAQFFTTATYPISLRTLAILFSAWWVLLVGALSSLERQPSIAPRDVTINKRRAIALILCLVSLQTALVIYEMPAGVAKQPSHEVVLALRTTSQSPGWSKCPWWLEVFRGAYFVYLPLAVLLRKHDWLSRRMFYTLVITACLLALTHMTRAPLLANMIALWASWALLYRPRALRAWGLLLGGTVAFGTVFVTIQAVLMSHQDHTAEGVQLVEGYYGGSMRAFESIVDGTFPREDGYYTADMVYYTLHKLNMVDTYPSVVRPYGNNRTNIYTFLDAYMLDAGLFGVLLGAAATGVVGGWLFTKASRRHDAVTLAAYAMFLYCIAMAPANNEFIRINPLLTTILAVIVNRFVFQGRASHTSAARCTARPLSPHRRSGPLIARA